MSAPNFSLKLLAGNGVVLIECLGYESEIFMPCIVSGCLTLQNIIPSRRCCSTQSLRSTNLSGADSSKTLSPSTMAPSRLKAGNNSKQRHQSIPVAYSTPVQSSRKPSLFQYYSSSNKENEIHHCYESHINDLYTLDSSILQATPEPVRRHVASPYRVIKDALIEASSGVKIVSLHRNHTLHGPRRRLSGGHVKDVAANVAVGSNNDTSDFRLLSTPEVNQPYLKEKAKTLLQQAESSLYKHVSNTGSMAKWRKCLTPQRTYGRRNNVSIPKQDVSCLLKETPRIIKVVPTYLANPTQGTKGTHKIEVFKRKLIVDPKPTISPVSFKKQQTESGNNKNELSTSTKLPKNSKNLEHVKLSAFDMITNSNRTSMSTKLSEQFRKACINKASSTYSKYKPLCRILDKKTMEVENATERNIKNSKLSSGNVRACSPLRKDSL